MSKTDTVEASNHTLQLHDGRRLGYAEYGHVEGNSLFYFHGHPGARVEAGLLAKSAAQAGPRLIGVDRPGLGLSSFQAGRRLVDWPGEVAALAQYFHFGHFVV